MKKNCISLFVSAFFLLAVSGLSAQRNIVKMTASPFGKIGLQYERHIQDDFSMTVEYQVWSIRRRARGVLFFPNDSDVTVASGYRLQISGRRYVSSDMSGLFLEGAAHFGTFDVRRKEESGSSGLLLGLLLGADLDNRSSKVTEYKNLKVNGYRMGGGCQKNRGAVTFDFSAGLEFNFTDSEAAKLVREFRFGAPYVRFSMGYRF